jgi:alpha-D-ribose 1-methylphosphonate 5-phosphate C-P lyase
MNNVLKFKNKKNTVAAQDEIYNFAYLDENTKRMIRRALIKALCIPGYQVPFSSREMPMPYGWGTGGVQVTSSCLTTDDVIKVIDQGADDTTNAVSIRNFFKKTANIETTEKNKPSFDNSDETQNSRRKVKRKTNTCLSGSNTRTSCVFRTKISRN